MLPITILFRPKWYQTGGWEPVTRIHDGFYALDKDSLDVVFIGSSYVFTGINPLLLWKEYGIRSYDMTSSLQRIWISKYYVQEVLKYQSPKVILLETGQFFLSTPNDEDRNRKALDYMKFSKEKLAAIRESILGSPGESLVSYFFPIIRYHKRWKTLTREDYEYFVSDKEFFLYGFDPRYDVENVQVEKLASKVEGSGILSVRNQSIIREIISICDKNNISLIFFKTPSFSWTLEEHNTTMQLAQEEGIDFIDYNFLVKETLVGDTDFNDVNHLNKNGADKISNHLGRYLSEKYLFDKEFDTDKWERNYEWYLDYDKEKRGETGLN